MTLEDCREEFEKEANRSLSMPVAGMIVWAAIGLASLQFPENISVYVLLFGTGAIFPIALIMASMRKEVLLSSKNPFAKLMGMSVLMVNLLWGVHIPLVLNAPEFVPLSLGIGLGLHWIVYSWIIQHPLGVIHAVLRTVLVVAAWYIFPESRIFAVSFAIVLAYSLTLYQMYSRKLEYI